VSDRGLIILAVIAAPLALVLLFAIIRGYTINLTLRRRGHDDDDT
jgi:hypothetical protein